MRFLFTLLALHLCITATGFVVVAQTNNTPFPQPIDSTGTCAPVASFALVKQDIRENKPISFDNLADLDWKTSPKNWCFIDEGMELSVLTTRINARR